METYIDRDFVRQSLPKRPRNAHKGNFGLLTVLAGSSWYRGAPALAAAGALRAGAGIVRIASIEKVCAAVAAQLPCCVFLPLRESQEGGIAAEDLPLVLSQKHSAILAGCGLMATRNTAVMVRGLLAAAEGPVVLDADGLNVLAGHLVDGEEETLRQEGLSALGKAKGNVVLTPHIGEMARLTELPPAHIQENQQQCALDVAKKYGCTVVLKSHATVVATQTGDLFIYDGGGNPGLAKAGSGDVLAGIVASLAAQGIALGVAAAAGVWLHGQAAKQLAEKTGEAGLSPAQLPEELALVLKELGR